MPNGKHLDWSVARFCLSCGSEMRAQTNKTSKLVAHEKEGLCRRCANTKNAGIIFDDKGQICFKCKKYKPFSDFTKSAECLSGHNSTCKKCKILWIHGIDYFTFEKILNSQGNRCAICQRVYGEFFGNWHIDHDHSCCGVRGKKSCGNCIRGILCGNCNSGIGMLQDDPKVIIEASKYLKNYKKKQEI
jgi:hypothetical protein